MKKGPILAPYDFILSKIAMAYYKGMQAGGTKHPEMLDAANYAIEEVDSWELQPYEEEDEDGNDHLADGPTG